MPNGNVNGHSKAMEASEKGAAAVIVEQDVETIGDTTVIKVDSTRYAMAYVAAAVNGYPSKKLKMIGITGTKGKTTTTYLVKSILESAG